MYYKNEIETLISAFCEKQAEKLQLPAISHLIDKLIELNIEDDQISQMIYEIMEVLNDFHSGDKTKRKAYKSAYNKLTEHARSKHGLAAKGYYVNLYLSLGIAIGSGLGVALMSAVNTAFFAIGIGAGISIGVAVGTSKENKAKSDGLLY